MSNQRQKKGYALKHERCLVPHVYASNSESFKAGAWKNWPHEMQLEQRSRQAHKETAGVVRGHCFPRNNNHA